MWRLLPDTPPLRPYQTEDVDILVERIEREGATCALHEQGLGKSRMALVVAAKLGAKRVLIHCPKIALISWAEEIAKWTDARFQVVKSGADAARLRADVPSTVCTFDLARSDAVRSALAALKCDFAIIDEAQYLRTPTAKRTKAIYARRGGTLAHVERALLMSGTIIVSWPLDLWPHLARFAPHRIKDETGARIEHAAFLHRYHVAVEREIPGTTATRLQIVRTRNDEELHQRLMGFAIRRRKADVAKDLPPITWRLSPLTFTKANATAVVKALADASVPTEIVAAVERSFAKGSPDDAVRMALESKTAVSTLTRVLGEVKAPIVADALRDELAESRYAVGVLYWNTAVGDVFEQALRPFGVVRIEGSTTSVARQKAVDAFRSPDGPRAFLGQISACGTALTLVRASRVIVPQMSWTPGENNQAVARFHRLGQTEPVDVRVPVFRDTIDDAFQRVLMRKSAAAAAVLEGVE